MNSLKQECDKLKNHWRKEAASHKFIYSLLGVILILGFFVRVYRTSDLMGFYYDQGRDALVIWKLWHEGRPFLIGPVTGLAGIFLGPFYYYLIAPFYLIGNGNPIYPAIFLAFLTVCGVFMLYYLSWKFLDRTTGIIAATIGSLSYYLILAGRWLANPTPIMFTSMLFLYSLWTIIQSKNRNWWIVASFLIGISLQLESASAVFYIPVILVFTLWQRKRVPDLKTAIFAFVIFIVILLPQTLFNIRHDNLIFNNFKRVLVEEKSFRLDFWQVFKIRLSYFWQVFYSKIFMEKSILAVVFTGASAIVLLSKFKSKEEFLPVKLLFIFLFVPMIGYIFFQGNFGNIYDYYMTCYYFPMILLFSLGLGIAWKKLIGKILVIAFFVIFLGINISAIKNYLSAGVDGPEHITLGNELQAVNWVFENSHDLSKFKVDVYVPPVFPHSYDYLFLWQGSLRQAQGKTGCEENLCGLVKDGETEVIYTLYEVDPHHPERLETWYSKFGGWTEIEKEVKFGGITVEKRKVL